MREDFISVLLCVYIVFLRLRTICMCTIFFISRVFTQMDIFYRVIVTDTYMPILKLLISYLHNVNVSVSVSLPSSNFTCATTSVFFRYALHQDVKWLGKCENFYPSISPASPRPQLIEMLD